MYISRSLHVLQDIILQVTHGSQRVRDVLVLLNIANDLGGFGAFGKIDETCAFDDTGDAVFNEG